MGQCVSLPWNRFCLIQNSNGRFTADFNDRAIDVFGIIQLDVFQAELLEYLEKGTLIGLEALESKKD